MDQNMVSSSHHSLIFYLSTLFGAIMISIFPTIRKRGKQSNKPHQNEKLLQISSAKASRKWSKRALFIGVLIGLCSSICIFSSMYADVVARRAESLANMCDERARVLQDQFNVSMNHVHALAILVSTFHHGKNPSAIDQVSFFPC
jgi:arabidopsis histidine kinase 2/3/4 (cytokinin receptor)